MVISPELADVPSAIMHRIRAPATPCPLVAACDDHERPWLPPAPVLFQRRIGAENRAIPARGQLTQLAARAATATGDVVKPGRQAPR
jgi:hypothetical protein